jgi:hypothetical protein
VGAIWPKADPRPLAKLILPEKRDLKIISRIKKKTCLSQLVEFCPQMVALAQL